IFMGLGNMRLKFVAGLAVLAAASAALALPAQAQSRRAPAGATETITVIDETGRTRTKVTVRPRSWLDPGPEEIPGSNKSLDYAMPPNYSVFYDRNNYNGTWSRNPLPGPFDVPGGGWNTGFGAFSLRGQLLHLCHDPAAHLGAPDRRGPLGLDVGGAQTLGE